MNIPHKVRSYLAESGIAFKGRNAPVGETFDDSVLQSAIPLGSVARPVVVKSGSVRLMAVIRADQELDLVQLSLLFKRSFELCDEEELAQIFDGCAVNALPPLAQPFGLRSIIDKSVAAMSTVYFMTGVEGLFISTTGKEFVEKLHEGAWKGQGIVEHKPRVIQAMKNEAEQMRQKIESVHDLPAMPGLAAEIISLRNNPYAHASELAAVIEQDPSLSAQVVRYATSPLYAYQGKIKSVEQAIVRVLGMDFVEDLAFGLSLARAFRNPRDGALGLDNFWRHSLYCATLTQALGEQLEPLDRPAPGVGYLAGLLHNFGILLLGHLFPAQFKHLNDAIAIAPDRPLLEIERQTLAVSHTEMGLWLMDAWDMPREIVRTVNEHHNPRYEDDYAVYPNLVYIANALLLRHGIGDAESMEIPQSLLDRYGLDEERLEIVLATVMRGQEGIEFMANKMAA